MKSKASPFPTDLIKNCLECVTERFMAGVEKCDSIAVLSFSEKTKIERKNPFKFALGFLVLVFNRLYLNL